MPVPAGVEAVMAWLMVVLLAALGEAGQVDADARLDLDGIERVVAPTGPMQCPKVELVSYRGDVVRYASPLRVNRQFRERLKRFEAVVRETAIEIYGRAPSRISHLGSFNCRRIRLWPTFLSEHGLGNALDVAGFVFPPLPRRTPLPADLPPALRRGFQVRVDPDWEGQTGVAAVHARFLHALTQKLVARTDIFRVMLGPAYPGHKNHFHLDCAPWRIVEL